MRTAPEQIPGIVLAGGLSRRMGGGDKGFKVLGGKPLICHVLERLAGQAAPIAINANGDPTRFAGFGLPVIPDATQDYAGPLAGILAGMRWAAEAVPQARFVVTAACDTPFFPQDLVSRFLQAANDAAQTIALATFGGRVHPIFGLWPLALSQDLADALANGTRKVSDWAESRPHVLVEFKPSTAGGKLADPFFNANTPAELAEAEALFNARKTL
jgi:molybdopterin-guanine dinucleotide biosynthesis protein A